MLSYKALLWKEKPTRIRKSFNSLLLSLFTSCPNTTTEPLSGFNNPASNFISTDLPAPERPSTIKFSPLNILILMSFKISSSPNDLYTPFKEMTGSVLSNVSLFSILLKIPYPIRYLNNDYLFYKYQKHSKNYRFVCCPAHSSCTLNGVVAFVTAYHANGKPKNS